MKTSTKVLLGLGTAGVVGGLVFAFSGDANAAGPGGGPKSTDPVAPPTDPAEVQAAKQTICTCYRGGTQTALQLLRCALGQVYSETDWTAVLDGPLQAVDELTRQTVELFSEWVEQFLRLDTAEARQQWCNVDEPVEPPVEPRDPPRPEPAQPNVPPPAPTWDPNRMFAEAPTAVAVVAEYGNGMHQPPAGKDASDHLTDVTMRRVYPNAPAKIPQNWQAGFGWQMWVDTWKRIHDHVLAAMGA